MKKIMFSDKYGLTKAVLNGRKTMTRRIVKSDNIIQITTSDGVVHHVDKSTGSYHEYKDREGKIWLAWSPFKVGDVVAVAQSYKDLGFTPDTIQRGKCVRKGSYCKDWEDTYLGQLGDWYIDQLAGWNNKMFVFADMCNHHIHITDIKFQRLQDINGYECIQEGIERVQCGSGYRGSSLEPIVIPQDFRVPNTKDRYLFVTEAIKNLFDGINGKGTWDRNPYVFAYSFELIQ